MTNLLYVSIITYIEVKYQYIFGICTINKTEKNINLHPYVK